MLYMPLCVDFDFSKCVTVTSISVDWLLEYIQTLAKSPQWQISLDKSKFV